MTIRILAIETSCDETSASVVEGIENPEIKTNIIASQIDLHKITGGVVPEVAARAHCESIIPVIEQALGGPIHKKIKDVDAIAVTVGPGLVGSLLVGVETAKALAFATDKPLIPINHLEGHIFAALQQKLNSKSQALNTKQIQNANNKNSKLFNKFENLNLDIISDLGFRISNLLPAIALLVSGGHTELVLVKDMFDYEVIGETLDDAAGEAFDKVGTLLGLEYPCGPKLSELAEKHRLSSQKSKFTRLELAFEPRRKSQNDNSKVKIKLPRPMLKSGDLNFSFSGLKTAVVNVVKQLESNRDGISSGVAGATLPRWRRSEIAYEFQEAVVEVLVEKTTKAFFQIQKSNLKSQNDNAKLKNIKSVLLTGGVSANKRLREAFTQRFGDKSALALASIQRSGRRDRLLVSPLELCGDNAGMIGLAGWHRLKVKSRPSRIGYRAEAENSNIKIANKNSKINTKNSKPILKSKILNLKSAFPWKSIDVDPNLEL